MYNFKRYHIHFHERKTLYFAPLFNDYTPKSVSMDYFKIDNDFSFVKN